MRRATPATRRHDQNNVFLSTLSLRRATEDANNSTNANLHFYPRSPCGERPYDGLIASANFCHFYPRSPCGERHAASITPAASRNFYPRSPCGERQLHINRAAKTVIFLSTLSLRRATGQKNLEYRYLLISIHALLAESDPTAKNRSTRSKNFYPRSPCGERRSGHDLGGRVIQGFLSTLSLRRATLYYFACPFLSFISIHALLAESDVQN